MSGQAKYGVEYLNSRVQQMVQDKAQEAKTSGKPLSDIYARVGQLHGGDIYQHRSRFVTCVAIAAIAVGLLYGFATLPLATTVPLSLLLWFYGDLYSGMFHAVLDDDKTILLMDNPIGKLVGIGQGALEFQWHHLIPTDIVQKDLMTVIGDLNMATIVITSINLLWFNTSWDTLASFIMSFRVFTAYVGQYAHRMAHTPSAKRSALCNQLMAWGLILSSDTHMTHHKSYDRNFSILNGWATSFQNYLHDILPASIGVGSSAYLMFLTLLAVVDVWAIHCVFNAFPVFGLAGPLYQDATG